MCESCLPTFPHLILFLASLLFSIIASFNRFSSAPLLCAFLILIFPVLTDMILPDRMPILITLLTEIPSFGYVSWIFFRLRLLDGELIRRFAVPVVLAASFGTLVAHVLPTPLLLFSWAILLLGVVVAWWYAPADPDQSPPMFEGLAKQVRTRDGVTYTYVCTRREIGLLLGILGAFFTGLTSFGLGEVETVNWVTRCRIPTRVAVGTSLTLALLAVLTASILHMTLFGLAGITLAPLQLSVWSGLGALAGTAVGMRGGTLSHRSTPARLFWACFCWSVWEYCRRCCNQVRRMNVASRKSLDLGVESML